MTNILNDINAWSRCENSSDEEDDDNDENNYNIYDSLNRKVVIKYGIRPNITHFKYNGLPTYYLFKDSMNKNVICEILYEWFINDCYDIVELINSFDDALRINKILNYTNNNIFYRKMNKDLVRVLYIFVKDKYSLNELNEIKLYCNKSPFLIVDRIINQYNVNINWYNNVTVNVNRWDEKYNKIYFNNIYDIIEIDRFDYEYIEEIYQNSISLCNDENENENCEV